VKGQPPTSQNTQEFIMTKALSFATSSAVLFSLFAFGPGQKAQACPRGGYSSGYSGYGYSGYSSGYSQSYRPHYVYQQATYVTTPTQTVQVTSTSSASTSSLAAAIQESRTALKVRNYGSALAAADKALKLSPQNSDVNQLKALILFSMGDFQKASASAYTGLSTGRAFTWPTLAQLSPSVDDYKRQYAALADQSRANPDQASLSFLLGYHHLMLGHMAEGRAALAAAQEKLPQDKLLPLLLSQLPAPVESIPAAPSLSPVQPAATLADKSVSMTETEAPPVLKP